MTEHGHGIGEQSAAYRRGLIVGLTMAEVGILIIFVLLLLLAFDQWARSGSLSVRRERIHGLEEIESTVDRMKALLGLRRDVGVAEFAKAVDGFRQSETALERLRVLLGVPQGVSADEITKLVQARLGIATSGGRTALEEMRDAIAEMRRIKTDLERAGGTEKLIEKAEEQAYEIARKEGQLKWYEKTMSEAGLGKGKRPCWVAPDGTIEFLYDVVLKSAGISMREYRYPHRDRERSTLPVSTIEPGELLSQAEFRRRTEALYRHSVTLDCRFFVIVYDSTGRGEKELYKELLRVVEGHFYKRLEHGSAPF